MSPPSGDTRSGPELMDADTFYDLYSQLGEVRRRRSRTAQMRPPRIPDIAELGARPLPRPSSSPEIAALLEAELGTCRSPHSVAELGAQLAGNYAAAVALLQVHRGMIQASSSRGMADREPALLFPADTPSLFSDVATSGRPFRGSPSGDALAARILRVLRRDCVREIAVIPVTVRSHTLGLLYADNGPEPLGDAAFAALGAACTRIASAYERLILVRKQMAARRDA